MVIFSNYKLLTDSSCFSRNQQQRLSPKQNERKTYIYKHLQKYSSVRKDDTGLQNVVGDEIYDGSQKRLRFCTPPKKKHCTVASKTRGKSFLMHYKGGKFQTRSEKGYSSVDFATFPSTSARPKKQG